MIRSSMNFPADCPDCCPPADAEPAHGVVLRLVTAQPPTDADLKTHHELGKGLKGDPCLRRGLSVLRSRLDAEHQHRLMPKLGSFVASGTLDEQHGKTKATPAAMPSHTTWWICENVDRASVLSSVEAFQ